MSSHAAADLSFDLEHTDDDDDIRDDPNESAVRAKWSMDGASTLTEAAQKLKSLAEALLQMEREGWQLTEPVADDYGFIRKSAEAKA